MIEEITEGILDTPFYVYRGSHGLWLGAVTPFGVMAFPLNEFDWIDWLREELDRCQPNQIPKVFLEGWK